MAVLHGLICGFIPEQPHSKDNPMEYEADGNPVVWKSVDSVLKMSEAVRCLTESASRPDVLSDDARKNIGQALDHIAVFVRKEALALRRVVDPKKPI